MHGRLVGLCCACVGLEFYISIFSFSFNIGNVW
jgi:hypothetical protein